MRARLARMRSAMVLSALLLALIGAPGQGLAIEDYTLFEAVPVRPLALSPDGRWLYSVNTPDDRLEVYRVLTGGLVHEASVSVGMRPVAVAVRPGGEVWVVNHLSDSVSVIDTRSVPPRVVRTLWVGDEPRDIVFAGPGRRRAFITTAHRGQNNPLDPKLTTPGVGRADVWVFDALDPGEAAGGTPLKILTLFADTPRALAVSPDGRLVYVAAFNSGNQTTVIDQGVASPIAEKNQAGELQPQTGRIAAFVDDRWIDSLGNDVSQVVNLNLPDLDVFTIDASARIPREDPARSYAHVGTTLFNLAVNPRSGALYVSNTDADNLTRFEGPGTVPGQRTVRGAAVQSRITVIKNGAVTPIHLNKHIDYRTCCAEPDNPEARRSLAFPREMAVSADGETLYVAAFGSRKLGVFSTEALESDRFVPRESSQIELTGGGPCGIALDERRGRLYVQTFFDNAVAIVDLGSRQQIDRVSMHTPEPTSIVEGRPFLYDARLSSSHGDSACASCHVDGDMDQLAWDLGDPTVQLPEMPGTAGGLLEFAQDPFGSGTSAFAFGLPRCSLLPPGTPCGLDASFRFASNKGPMTTQTLRGMDNHGSMHWRGDRGAGTPGDPGAQPDGGMFDEQAAFLAFNVAFPGLVGRSGPLPLEDMKKFAAFALELTLPPNPIHNLDNSLTEQQERGREIYFGGPDPEHAPRRSDFFRTCNGCHRLDPLGNAEFGVAHPGFFGSDGRFSFEAETQMLKIPHLRNAYQKVGMFGPSADRSRPVLQNPRVPFQVLPAATRGQPQVRGFGFQHDGALDTVDTFLQALVFTSLEPKVQAVVSPLFKLPNSGGFRPFFAPGSLPDPADVPPLPPPSDRLPVRELLPLLNDPFYQQREAASGEPLGERERRALESFVLAFPTNLAPIVGQQVTLGRGIDPAARRRLTLLIERASASAGAPAAGGAAEPLPECELIAHGFDDGHEVGYLYEPARSRFRSSEGRSITRARLELQALRVGHELTFTCVPPGSGERAALDRDRDGVLDTLEEMAGSDPADPQSVPRGR